MMMAASCRGKNGYKRQNVAYRSYSIDSCKVKKLLDITDDASGIGGAIAGISAVIRQVAPYSPWIGAMAGLIWLERYAIKKISADGKYGISFKILGASPNGLIIIIPWRQ